MIIGVKGLIFTGVLGPESTYLAFLAFGMIFWQLLAGLFMSGVRAFENSKASILEGTLPLPIYALTATAHQIILFAHSLLLVPLVYFLTGQPVFPVVFLIIPAILICIVNGVWIAMTLGILQLRFRDLGSFFEPVLRGMFFLTPVFWDPDIVTGARRAVIDYNPFYYFLEMLRAPLLGYAPDMQVWLVCGSFTFAGGLATVFVYGYYRNRLAYWL